MSAETNPIQSFLQEIQDLVKTQKFLMPDYDVREHEEVISTMTDFEKACYTIKMENEQIVQEKCGQVMKMENDHLNNPSLPAKSPKLDDEILLLQRKMTIAHDFMILAMKERIDRTGRFNVRKGFVIVTTKKDI